MGEQTLRGLAGWLASMDEPGSEARRTVTLDQIVTEAKDALENDGRSLFTQHEQELRAERDQLRQQVERLLGAVDAHRGEAPQTTTPQKFARDEGLYSAADQVRKELGE